MQYAQSPPTQRSQLEDLDAYPSEYSVTNAKAAQAAQAAARRARQAQDASTLYSYEQLQGGDNAAAAGYAYPALARSPASTPSSSSSRQQQALPQPASSSASDDLMDADMIAALHHQKAITYWSRCVKICFVLHLITALCLLHSYYWFSTVIGLVLLVAIWLYAYAIHQRQTNFVLSYLVVVVVNLAKNVLILYFYFRDSRQGQTLDSYDYFLVALMIIDASILTVRPYLPLSPEKGAQRSDATTRQGARDPKRQRDASSLTRLPL